MRCPRIGHARDQSDVVDALEHAVRRDPVLLVVLALNSPTSIGFVDRALHRSGNPVGVQDRPAIQMARGTPDRLDERPVAAQESFLVGIKNRHQRHLGHIQPLAQQIDADEYIELAQPKPAHNLHALDSVDVGVHVAHTNAHLLQIVREIFRHALGQRRHQHALAFPFSQTDLVQQIIDLPLHRTNFQDRIKQTRRPDHLLDHHTFRQLQLELARRGRHVHEPGHQLHELIKNQRSIVECTRQPEAVIDQRKLPRTIAVVHTTDLRKRDMRLVDHHEIVVGEVIQQTGRTFSRLTSADMARIILDAGTGTDLRQHFQIEICALIESLRFQQLSLQAKLCQAFAEFLADRHTRALDRRAIRDEMLRRIDRHPLQRRDRLAGERIDL